MANPINAAITLAAIPPITAFFLAFNIPPPKVEFLK